MSKIKDMLDNLEKMNNEYYQIEIIKPFTVDLIKDCVDLLQILVIDEGLLNNDNLINSLKYRVFSALEICDNRLLDFQVIQGLYDIINSQK